MGLVSMGGNWHDMSFRWLRARLPNVTQITVDSASIDIDTPADAARLASSDFMSQR